MFRQIAELQRVPPFKIEEFALLGESVPVTKTDEVLNLRDSDGYSLGDRKNMCYMGSSVAYGRGKAVVVATGMNENG